MQSINLNRIDDKSRSLKGRLFKFGRLEGICYSLHMGKRKIKQTEKNNTVSEKKKSGLGAIPIFLITLCLVLSVGLVGILIIGFATGKGFQTNRSEGVETVNDSGEREEFHFIWEDIPEDSAQEEESTRYGHELADEDYMRENHILAWEGKDSNTVTFGFVGDILFDDEYAIMANLLRRGGTIKDGISEPLLEQLRDVDVLVANNEFPFTEKGMPTEGKAYTFRADPETTSYLHDMGVDVAVLANNHIYDFGETGLLDTLDTLATAGIPSVGAGKNLDEAVSPLYFIVNDMKIAIVAATQIERLDNPDTKGATESSAGVFRCWNPEKLYEVVSKAKENSDFVIVYIHWGTENETDPDWAQLEQASGLAEAGADLIIGDHPHCLQGIAYYGDTPVIYSLGNFWFNSKTVDTGMVQVTIGQNGLESFRFLPAIQSDCRVDLAYGEDKERILSFMRSLSPEVLIDEEGYVSRP